MKPTPTARPGRIRAMLSDAVGCVAIFTIVVAALLIAHGFGL